MAEGKSDTAHLYDGKTIRSSAPSRKKAAGRLKGSTVYQKMLFQKYTFRQ